MAKQIERTLKAFGITRPKRKTGAGRPVGTFKYGMPISQYKKAMTSQRELYNQQRQREIMMLQRRGFSPEQIQEMQLARTLEERGRGIVPDSRTQMMRGAIGIADDEKEFTRFRKDKMISPNTQAILTRLRRIQNKGEIDNMEMQRRIFERRMVAEAGNLLKAKNLFGPDSNTLNLLEVEGNILTAPSVFKENPENNILRTNRLNIMQTREGGNNLRFF